MKFPLKLTCTQMCPGGCVGKLPSDVLLAAEALRRATDRWTAGTAFRLAATGEDGATYFSYKVWCFSDSTCVVLVACVSDGSKLVLKDDDQVGVVFEVAHKELSNLWQKCGGTCTSLVVTELLRDASCVSGMLPRYTLSSGSDERDLHIWPVAAAAAGMPSGSVGASDTKDAIRETVEAMRLGLRQPTCADVESDDEIAEDEVAIMSLEESALASLLRKAPKRRMPLPRRRWVPKKKARGSATMSGGAGPGAAVGVAAVPPEPALIPFPGGLAEHPDPPPAAPMDLPPALADREARSIAWGEFSYAPIFKTTAEGKVQIGWGGNCHRHRNMDDHLKCQKQLTFPAHSAPDVVDEHRRVCKLWLLLGRGVPEDAPNGREWHLKDIGGRGFRRNASDVSESRLGETVLIPGALLE